MGKKRSSKLSLSLYGEQSCSESLLSIRKNQDFQPRIKSFELISVRGRAGQQCP